MAGTLLPLARQRFFDSVGAPLSGGKLYIFDAGTTTPRTVFSDINLTVAHTHPIILDSAGRVSAGIYIDALTVKVRLDDSLDVTIWTQDNVPSTAVSASGLGRQAWFFGGDHNYEYDNTAYISGSDLNDIAFGSGVWLIDSTQLSGTFVLEAEVVSPLGGTATIALVNLTDAPDTAVTGSEVSGTGSTTGERIRSAAITFAASGADKSYAVKVRTSDAAQPVAMRNARIIQTA